MGQPGWGVLGLREAEEHRRHTPTKSSGSFGFLESPEREHRHPMQSRSPECDALYVNYIPGFGQILCSKAENARLIIQVDNAKLAADDFRIK